MNEVAVPSGSPFDGLRRIDDQGEFWSARDLCSLMGYRQWGDFKDVVTRASAACRNSGQDPNHHISFVRHAGGVADYRLTRHGGYLAAMNGDPLKPEVAAAQTYFATRTREAEVSTPQFDADLQHIHQLMVVTQQTRNEVRALNQAHAALASEVKSVVGDVADLLAISPLTGGSDLTLRDAARAVTGQEMGRQKFAEWLVGTGVLFRDQDDKLRCYQSWIQQGLATESYERWENGRGFDWVTRFTPRGVTRLTRMWVDQ